MRRSTWWANILELYQLTTDNVEYLRTQHAFLNVMPYLIEGLAARVDHVHVRQHSKFQLLHSNIYKYTDTRKTTVWRTGPIKGK